MNKVIVKLRGGLGNQLFQYAYAEKVFSEGTYEKIILDVSYFSKQRIRNLEINDFILPKYVELSNKRQYFVDALYFLYRIKNKFIKNEKPIILQMGRTRLILTGKTLSREIKQKKNNTISMAGYFQNARFANVCKEKITGLNDGFSNKGQKYIERIQGAEHPVAVSIRMGDDYKKFGWPVCNREFYINGVNRIKECLGSNVELFVFSDCIDKVKEEKWFENCTYVNGCSVAESMWIMKECKHFVMSNSTFSWWGAFFASEEAKKIIAPKYFYNNEIMMDSDLFFGEMHFLDNFSGEYYSK